MTKRASLVLGIVSVLLFLGFMFAMRSGFFRSEAWISTSLILTATFAGIAGVWLTRQVFKVAALSKLRVSYFSAFMIWALFTVFGGLFFFFAVAYTLPDLYTRVAGNAHHGEYAGLSLLRRSGMREACPRAVTGAPFARGGFHPHYCASGSEYSALRPNGTMRVRWRETWFGRHIVRVEPAPVRD